jgi:hypothetical protein
MKSKLLTLMNWFFENQLVSAGSAVILQQQQCQ